MAKKVNLSPPPNNIQDTNSRGWRDWFRALHSRVGEEGLLIQGYAVASLPTAADFGSTTAANAYSALIFVYDETGGATVAFSDGTNWRRVQDRAIVA